MSFTAPKTWTNGESVSDNMLNTHLRDNLNELWKYANNGDLMYSTSATTSNRLAIGSNLQSLKVVNGVPAWSDPIYCRAQKPSAVTTESGTVSYPAFTIEDDPYGFVTLNDDKLVVPANYGGVYMVCASVYYDGISNANKKFEIIVKVGATNYRQSCASVPYENMYLTITVLCSLISTDQIQVGLYQTSGVNVNANSTNLFIAKIA